MNQPPDGFADNQAGPPDGFADEQSKYGAKDYIGDLARPLLEGGGAIAGGAVGLASPVPGGAAIGGALGFGGGKAAADLLDRGLGRKPLLQNLPQAASETGQDLAAGAGAEMLGQGLGKVTKPILNGIGKAGSTMGEWATGIPAKDFKSVANNPKSILPGTMEKAGNQFETAMKNAGISSELTPEAVGRIRQPGQFAFDAFDKLQKEGSISPQDALHARQSIDSIYPIPNQKNGSYIRLLDQMRQKFQDVISNTTPELKDASKNYAIAKSGSKFQHLLPQTTTGKPSYFRSAAILGGTAAGHPMSLFGVPAIAGATTAGAGAINKAATEVIGNPLARRAVSAGLEPSIQDIISNLTKDQASKLLQEVDNSAENARDKVKSIYAEAGNNIEKFKDLISQRYGQ